jgi:hypothetical protein
VFAGRGAKPGEDAFYLDFDSVPMGRIKVHVTGDANDESGSEKVCRHV